MRLEVIVPNIFPCEKTFIIIGHFLVREKKGKGFKI